MTDIDSFESLITRISNYQEKFYEFRPNSFNYMKKHNRMKIPKYAAPFYIYGPKTETSVKKHDVSSHLCIALTLTLTLRVFASQLTEITV